MFSPKSKLSRQPPGGVEEGQSFTVPWYPPSALSKSGPVGAWKDDICSCFAYGIFHPHLCLAWWFSPLALAHVMVRMRLDWCGSQDTLASSASTFTRVLILSLGYMIFMYVLPSFGIIKGFQLAFWFYMIIAIIRTRQAIRSKYAIPEQSFPGCEDAVCAVYCGCCTIMQMSRHTADYDTYEAQCCSEDGLPSNDNTMV